MSELATTIRLAMKLWAQQQADGVSWEDRVAGLERTLLAAWPQTRVWVYLCALCDDYGFIFKQCVGQEACGRRQPHGPHSFGIACSCEKGRPFRPAAPQPEDFTKAGRARSWKRVGL